MGIFDEFKRLARPYEDEDEDDYDDFSDALEDEDTRSYVPLNTETAQAAGTDDAPAQEVPEEAGEKGVFTPLTEQVAQTMEKAEETVEEFFDEDDDFKQETPINDN